MKNSQHYQVKRWFVLSYFTWMGLGLILKNFNHLACFCKTLVPWGRQEERSLKKELRPHARTLFSPDEKRDALHHSLDIVFVISQWDYFLGSHELYLQLGLRGWYVRVERGICWDFVTLWSMTPDCIFSTLILLCIPRRKLNLAHFLLATK